MRHFSLALLLVAVVAIVNFSQALDHTGAPLAFGRNAQDVPTLAPLVKKVELSVVSIAIRGHLIDQQNAILDDHYLRDPIQNPEPAEREIYPSGSGVIIDAARGFIVTNNHVIENADEIVVALADGQRIHATLVGADADSDIAVLRIEANNLVAIPFGNSDLLEVGDFVIALGSPFNLDHTVTAGIVSALRRHDFGLLSYEDFIQTDAAINPGSSGGALVNLGGELVGINAALVGENELGSGPGIGFAIPASIVRSIADQLVKFGVASHGRLEVTVQSIPPELMRIMDLTAGLIITNVEGGSSSERAGLQNGDVLITVNSIPVRDPTDLRNKVGIVRAGEIVRLGILRGGNPTRIDVMLAARKEG